MGYRAYISSISNKYLKFRNLSKDDLIEQISDEDDHFRFPDSEKTILHELGKYVSFAEDYDEFFLFRDNGDTEFKFFDKEGVMKIIMYYQDEVSKHYKEMNIEIERSMRTNGTIPGSVVSHIRGKKMWTENGFLNLDEDNPQLSSSWQLEHEAFDLLNVYKTFDYENNILIYEGR